MTSRTSARSAAGFDSRFIGPGRLALGLRLPDLCCLVAAALLLGGQMRPVFAAATNMVVISNFGYEKLLDLPRSKNDGDLMEWLFGTFPFSGSRYSVQRLNNLSSDDLKDWLQGKNSRPAKLKEFLTSDMSTLIIYYSGHLLLAETGPAIVGVDATVKAPERASWRLDDALSAISALHPGKTLVILEGGYAPKFLTKAPEPGETSSGDSLAATRPETVPENVVLLQNIKGTMPPWAYKDNISVVTYFLAKAWLGAKGEESVRLSAILASLQPMLKDYSYSSQPIIPLGRPDASGDLALGAPSKGDPRDVERFVRPVDKKLIDDRSKQKRKKDEEPMEEESEEPTPAPANIEPAPEPTSEPTPEPAKPAKPEKQAKPPTPTPSPRPGKPTPTPKPARVKVEPSRSAKGNQPPTCTIVKPTGEITTASAIVVHLEGNDPDGTIEMYQIHIDSLGSNKNFYESTGSRFSIDPVKPGRHKIFAKAIDDKGDSSNWAVAEFDYQPAAN